MPNFGKILEELNKPISARIKGSVTEASHPELFKAVVELCERAKIKLPYKIHLFEEAFGLPNAAMSSRGYLFLGNKMLETFGYSHKNPVVSKELEAIIAHELGHSTRPNDPLILNATITAGPLALYGGYKLYEHAKRRQQEKGHGNIRQHIEITAHEAGKEANNAMSESTLPEEQKQAQHRLKKLTMSYLKESAIFAAASIVTIPITKMVGRPMELGADKYAASLVGAEHMTNALKKLDQEVTKILTSNGVPESLQKLARLVDYHPSVASRVSHLARL